MVADTITSLWGDKPTSGFWRGWRRMAGLHLRRTKSTVAYSAIQVVFSITENTCICFGITFQSSAVAELLLPSINQVYWFNILICIQLPVSDDDDYVFRVLEDVGVSRQYACRVQPPRKWGCGTWNHIRATSVCWDIHYSTSGLVTHRTRRMTESWALLVRVYTGIPHNATTMIRHPNIHNTITWQIKIYWNDAYYRFWPPFCIRLTWNVFTPKVDVFLLNLVQTTSYSDQQTFNWRYRKNR